MTADSKIVVGIEGQIGGGKVVERTLNDISRAGDKAKNSAKGAQSQFNSLDSAADKLSNTLKGLGIAFGLRELQQTVDTYTNIQNRLKLVTDGTAELTAVTKELFSIANETRVAFEGTAEVYARTAQATKEMGLTQQETLAFTKSLNQAVVLSGASAMEAQAGMIQLSQGLASGALRGDELRSVLEQLPAVADVIAKGLGVTRGQLRDMGKDGQITADVIIDAFAKASNELNTNFAKTVPTIGQSFVILKNRVTEVIGEFDKANGVSAALAGALITVADNIKPIITVVALATTAWVAYRTALLLATGAGVLNAIAGTVTSLSGAMALLNATFMVGPGAFIAILVTAGVAMYKFRKEIQSFIIEPLAEVIIMVDKAVAAFSRYFGNGSGSNLTGQTAEQIRSSARDIIIQNGGGAGPDPMFSEYEKQQKEMAAAIASNKATVTAGVGTGSSESTGKKTKQYDPQKELKDLIVETSTEQEKLLNKVKELEKLKVFAKSAEEVQAINRALEIANKQLETASTELPGLSDPMERLIRQTDKFAESTADAFGSFIDGSKTAREALGSLISDLQKMVIQETVTGPLSDAFRGMLGGLTGGKGGKSGGLGSIFGSIGSSLSGGLTKAVGGIGSSIGKLFGFDSGGSMVLGGAGGVDANTLSLNGAPIANVGRGEVLSISPTRGNNSGGITVNQTINVSTGVAESIAAEMRSFVPRIQEATMAAINEQRLRGIT